MQKKFREFCEIQFISFKMRKKVRLRSMKTAHLKIVPVLTFRADIYTRRSLPVVGVRVSHVISVHEVRGPDTRPAVWGSGTVWSGVISPAWRGLPHVSAKSRLDLNGVELSRRLKDRMAGFVIGLPY